MNTPTPKRLAIAGACLYALMTVITFGRAWERGGFAGNDQKVKSMNRFLGSSFAAILWPYYWSTVLWEKPSAEVRP